MLHRQSIVDFAYHLGTAMMVWANQIWEGHFHERQKSMNNVLDHPMIIFGHAEKCVVFAAWNKTKHFLFSYQSPKPGHYLTYLVRNIVANDKSYPLEE